MSRWNTFLMTAMLGHVVVIFLEWLHPRKFCAHDTTGQPCLKIILLQSNNVILVKYTQIKCMNPLPLIT